MVNHLLLDTRCPICRHDSSKRERANDEERAHEDEERAHGDEDILEDREEFDTRSEALSNRKCCIDIRNRMLQHCTSDRFFILNEGGFVQKKRSNIKSEMGSR